MGRGFKKRGGHGGKEKEWKRNDNDWAVTKQTEMHNGNFEAYYKAQGLLSDDEWDAFMTSLREPLPTTFRVTGSRAHAETINTTIQSKYVPTMQSIEVDGQVYGPPTAIPWYPGGLAWQIDAPKRVVRKSEPYKVFQRFLVGETDVGNLSRQEAVSMIPPLFLDVRPEHKCLDMCAAPGSKTAQIIEALNPHHTESTGMLIANDSDYKRTHMLVHQTGRMPSKGLAVTNFDAYIALIEALLPNIDMGNGETLKFDRILADVPCSGDGTLRKNIEIWKRWGLGDGNSLHGLQLRILLRGMDLLAPSGRLVYSTCSFNPSENESVIAAALLARPGIFHIVDVASVHPELRRRPGVSSWKVATQPEGSRGDVVWHETYDDYQKRLEAGEERTKDGDKSKGIPRSLWPPSNAEDLHLERCMRLFPHDQNTGGFFVCVLEKSASPSTVSTAPDAPLPIPEATSAAETSTSTSNGATKRELSPSASPAPESKKPKAGPPKKLKRDLGFKEEPFTFVDPDHEEIKSILEWYRMKSGFPKDSLIVRNESGSPLRSLYIVNPHIKAIIQNNDFSRLRLVSAGVKVFVRQDSQNRSDIACKWRIPGEGVGEVLPHLGEGLVREGNMEDLRVLVEYAYPSMTLFRDETRTWLEGLQPGNVLMRFPASKGAGGELPMDIVLPIWRARTSASLLIDKKEKSMLSLRTFGADLCRPAPKPKNQTGGDAVVDADTGEAPEHEEVENVPIEGEGVEDGEDGGVVLDAEEAAIGAP